MKNCKEARAWDDAFDREFYTPEEISESDMRADIITAMIEEREAVGNGKLLKRIMRQRSEQKRAKHRSEILPIIGFRLISAWIYAKMGLGEAK